MWGLRTETFKRPADLSNKANTEVRFARSYLRMRLAIGFVGVLLPLALWTLEGPLLKGGWRLRESLSAYYYSGARDVFVGSLCICGFLMITYSTGRWRSPDFIFSLLAGLAALGIALFPAQRPDAETACGTTSQPLSGGCTVLQQRLGEAVVDRIHSYSAMLFIAFLAVLCWVFSKSEERITEKESDHRRHARFHQACAGLILIAGLWAILGNDMEVGSWRLTSLYAGEVVAILLFGASWIAMGFDLVKQVATEAGNWGSERTSSVKRFMYRITH